jgi:hypothetical protein
MGSSTAIELCNGPSVGILTAYTARCAIHDLKIGWEKALRKPPFHYSTLSSFSYAINSSDDAPAVEALQISQG